MMSGTSEVTGRAACTYILYSDRLVSLYVV